MIRLESRHDVSFPPEAVWPILARTDWLNRAVGLPPVTYEITPRAEGGSTVIGRTKMLGLELRWREFPFEWSEPLHYRVRRVFETGPFTEARLGMELARQSGGGTEVLVYSEITPRHFAGKLLVNAWIGPKTRRDMKGVMAHLEKYLRGRAAIPLPNLPASAVDENVLLSGLGKLRATEQPPELLRQFEDWLRAAPDVEMTHIRPFAEARKWRRDQWEVFRLFLYATRAGLLDFSWEILCPNCRSTREPRVGSLGGLKQAAHCDVCNIRFDADFGKSVELKFAVNAAVRPVVEQTFCLAGPGGKPHVAAQVWLEPGEQRDWQLPALTRPFRLQSAQVRETLELRPGDAPTPGESLRLSCEPEKFVLTRAAAGAADQGVTIINPNAFPVLVSLEETGWSEDILTAAQATNWQEFRDLFANEVISPAEQVTVGSLVVLFTDLRGSTALYQGIGDARAYVLVRNHFAILTEAIRQRHGTVVKTMGDAVMATFCRVDEALAATREIHTRLAAEQATPGLDLALKSSLHHGPCLAVNANGRLDYFGTTINLGARLVQCCQGGDVTVSADFFARPEMVDFLKDGSCAPESLEKTFRGFDQPQRVWRIKLV